MLLYYRGLDFTSAGVLGTYPSDEQVHYVRMSIIASYSYSFECRGVPDLVE